MLNSFTQCLYSTNENKQKFIASGTLTSCPELRVYCFNETICKRERYHDAKVLSLLMLFIRVVPFDANHTSAR